jgi:hypothetical protein
MLGVNSNSYNKFMNGKYKHQWSAAENQTYDAAARFFLREQKLGKQAVGKSRAKAKGEVAGCTFPDISDVLTGSKITDAAIKELAANCHGLTNALH